MTLDEVERLKSAGNERKLLKATKDGSAEVRRAAALALGDLQARSATSRVSDLLIGDPDDYVRSAAARALERIADPGAVPRLAWSLENDQDRFVRKCAASALGACGPSAVPPLRRASAPESHGGDFDSMVREAAAKALGKIDDPAARKALQAKYRANDASIGGAVQEALAPEIVGESHYQDTLRALKATAPPHGRTFPATVWLYAEPTNPHDPRAVVAAVDSQRVGYLRREVASRYFDWLLEHGPVSCEAEIRGVDNLGVYLLTPPAIPGGAGPG